ncbi:MAG: CDP-diacylglycerol--serine O-phosphatidyltransferase [Desulfobacterales bacterium]
MTRRRKIKGERLRRGIYILPNIFTSLNIFFGFYSVIAAINGTYVAAALAIIIAAVFDLLDGKIARATHTTSKFGVEYDSLADLVSFGLAPGLMMYLYALKPLGRIGWLAAFLFMVCGALRLARFNTQVGTISSDHFVGLPIPAAAAMNASTILLWHRFGFAVEPYRLYILVMLYALAFLMVSNIRYNSFKKAALYHKMTFNVLVAAILILIFIAAQPSIAIFALSLSYVVSGPLGAVWRHFHKLKTEDAKSQESHEIDEKRTTP